MLQSADQIYMLCLCLVLPEYEQEVDILCALKRRPGLHGPVMTQSLGPRTWSTSRSRTFSVHQSAHQVSHAKSQGAQITRMIVMLQNPCEYIQCSVVQQALLMSAYFITCTCTCMRESGRRGNPPRADGIYLIFNISCFCCTSEYIWKLFAKMVQSVCHHQSAVQKDLYGN